MIVSAVRVDTTRVIRLGLPHQPRSFLAMQSQLQSLEHLKRDQAGWSHELCALLHCCDKSAVQCGIGLRQAQPPVSPLGTAAANEGAGQLGRHMYAWSAGSNSAHTTRECMLEHSCLSAAAWMMCVSFSSACSSQELKSMSGE